VKGSVESINFTRQHVVASNSAAIEGGRGGGFAGMEQIGSSTGTDAASGSAMGALANQPFQSQQQREGDPFYLSSSATPAGRLLEAPNGSDAENKVKDAAQADAAAVASRFGSIQLDSGGESEEGHAARSRKKKKKKVKKTAAAHRKFVESDDDDDDHNDTAHSPSKRGSAVSREFQNLALVDLTTPLGEDEVMPRNEHYVVPDRPPVPMGHGKTKSGEEKKAKKKKKKKKHKADDEHTEDPMAGASSTPAAVGDLLGFDSMMAFGSSSAGDAGGSAAATALSLTAAPPSGTNLINDAFDDLLGLDMPSTSSQQQPKMAQSNAATTMAEKDVAAVSTIDKSKEKKKKKKKKEGKHSKKKASTR